MLRAYRTKLETFLGWELRRRPRPDRRYATYAAALGDCARENEGPLAETIYAQTKAYGLRLSYYPLRVNPSQAFAWNVLQLLTAGKQRLSVIDFGGACGAHYLLLRKLLPECRLCWHVVETPEITRQARNISSSELFFFPSIQAATHALKGAVDLVFTANALHHTDDPLAYLESLLLLKAPHVALLHGVVTDQDSPLIFRDKHSPVVIPPKRDVDACLAAHGYQPLITFEDDGAPHAQRSLSALFRRTTFV